MCSDYFNELKFKFFTYFHFISPFKNFFCYMVAISLLVLQFFYFKDRVLKIDEHTHQCYQYTYIKIISQYFSY